MIQVDIQEKKYQECILKDLHFSISAHEIVAIVGPSGAGKTTLLNILSGLDQEYQGSITYEDQAPLKTSMMFQQPRLMPWLTVIQNVMLAVNDSAENYNKAKESIALIGLKNHMHNYPRQLSGGMQKRVALARTFMPDTNFLLMDEPFVSLDVPAAALLRQQFIKLWHNNKPTVIYVTHDLNEAIVVADRILFLSPSPATIILEQAAPSTSSDLYSHEVHAVREKILLKHPNVLSGKL